MQIIIDGDTFIGSAPTYKDKNIYRWPNGAINGNTIDGDSGGHSKLGSPFETFDADLPPKVLSSKKKRITNAS